MRTARRRPYGAPGSSYGPSSPAAPVKRTRSAPYLFLLPATALFALFFALPIGYAVWLSLGTGITGVPGTPAWNELLTRDSA
ncbi:sugar ABC transporter permease, partial [Streptomyces sp. NPDC005568]